MSRELDWAADGATWPHHQASRFVEVDGILFHVQIMGEGPDVLLIHGTGASTHSWRDVMPLLAANHRVIAPDLPGHGFTQTPANDGLSLPGMASRLTNLMTAVDAVPKAVIGHSAGAAIAITMAGADMLQPAAIIGINAALKPFGGPAAQLFPSMAKLLFVNPIMPRLFAWRAQDESAVQRLIDGTGSRLTSAGLTFYRRLFADRHHVAATLGMMANWDLSDIDAAITRLPSRLTLIVGERDKAVSPEEARQMRKRHPAIDLITLPGLGHLAHEEDPAQVCGHLARILGMAA
jgi:magnesium chelatase accessory protein